MTHAQDDNKTEQAPSGAGPQRSALRTPHSSLPIIVRLEAMQQRARRLLLVHGLAITVLGGCSAALILFTLDWKLWFPGFIRFSFALAWLGLLAWIIARHVWPPLFSRFSTLHVATKIEEHFPEFQDRLTSAVSFVSEDYTVQDPLQEKLIERTEQIAKHVPVEDALTSKPVWLICLLTAVPVATLIALATLSTVWTGTAFHRFVLPFDPLQWPKTVNIQPLTADLTVASGESVVVSMNVTLGQTDSLRSYLYIRRGQNPPERLVMRREGTDGESTATRYAWTLNTITEHVQYWFQAGDDSTKDRPGTIRVVNRPRILDLQLAVTPPSYVTDAAVVVLPSGQHNVELIEGSTLLVTFRSSKPLGRNDSGRAEAWVSTDTGKTVIAEADADQDRLFAARLTPQRDQQCLIHLVDLDGFENEEGGSISITVRQDSPPAVALIKPVEVLEVTPQAVVQIVGSARDDLGISHIELAGTVHPTDKQFTHAVTQWRTSSDSALGTTARAEFTWTLSDLQLRLGDRVEYTLIAKDNRLTDTLSPQTGRAHTMQLVVVSQNELAAAVADELNRLSQRLRRYLQQQQQLLEDTQQHEETLRRAPEFDPDARFLRLSTRQRALAQRIAAVGKNAESLADELKNNRINRTSEKQQAQLFADQLDNLVEPDMHQAATILNDARGRSSRDDQAGDARQAAEFQRTAIKAIRALLEQLTTWNDYRSVLANLRELIDQQQQVSRRTAEVQQKTFGHDVERLSDKDRAKLQRNAQGQDGVTTALERALAELGQLQAKLRRSEPDDARALSEAERKLAGKDPAKRSRSAAGAIRNNLTAHAQSEQTAVQRALAEAVSHLETREQRKLAELSKKISNIEELIQRLVEQQQQLREQTRKTTAQDATRELPTLASRQRNLSRAARQVVDTLADLRGSEEAKRHVHTAAGSMTRATDALYEVQIELAIETQNDAIDHLQQAKKLLQELREQNEKALERAKLFAIKRELNEIRMRQAHINTETEKVVRRVQQAGRLTRLDVRRTKKQARAQQTLITKLNETHEKLTETPIYAWVIERVGRVMRTSEAMLIESKLQDSLIRVQRRAVSYLDQLIDALKQAEALVDEQFAAGGGAAGGGQMQMTKSKPVPTVAELIVLKGVQQDIAERTQQLAEETDPDQPTEEELAEAKQLGEEQQEVKLLVEELTRKARERP